MGGLDEVMGSNGALDVVGHLHEVSAGAYPLEIEIGGARVRAWLAPPTADRRSVGVWVNQPGDPPLAPLCAVVRVSYVIDGRPFGFLSTVIGRLDATRWVLAVPRSLDRGDRRGTRRVPISEEDGLRLRIDLGLDEPVVVCPRDLSCGGLSFSLPAALAPVEGTALPLRLLLGGESSIPLLVAVANVRADPGSPEGVVVGCRIIGASAFDQAALARVIVDLGRLGAEVA
jgi:hypothetical protein